MIVNNEQLVPLLTLFAHPERGVVSKSTKVQIKKNVSKHVKLSHLNKTENLSF